MRWKFQSNGILISKSEFRRHFWKKNPNLPNKKSKGMEFPSQTVIFGRNLKLQAIFNPTANEWPNRSLQQNSF